jgi:hypothetical protein
MMLSDKTKWFFSWKNHLSIEVNIVWFIFLWKRSLHVCRGVTVEGCAFQLLKILCFWTPKPKKVPFQGCIATRSIWTKTLSHPCCWNFDVIWLKPLHVCDFFTTVIIEYIKVNFSLRDWWKKNNKQCLICTRQCYQFGSIKSRRCLSY